MLRYLMLNLFYGETGSIKVLSSAFLKIQYSRLLIIWIHWSNPKGLYQIKRSNGLVGIIRRSI